MTDWTPRADGGFERILAEPITAEALARHRLVVDLKGVPVVGDSYTAYLYANEPASPDAPRMAAEAGFLNRVAVFGHGECGGEAGHCGLRSREAVDPRLPYHAAPQDIVIDLTDAALSYIREKGPIRKLRLATHVRRGAAAGTLALAATPRRLPFASASVRLLSPAAFAAEARGEISAAARAESAPVAAEATGREATEGDFVDLATRVAKLESRLRRVLATPGAKPKGKSKAMPAAGKAATARPGKKSPAAKAAGAKRTTAPAKRAKASAKGASRRAPSQ